MPVEDLLITISDDFKIPGIATAYAIAFRKAVQRARIGVNSLSPATASGAGSPLSGLAQLDLKSTPSVRGTTPTGAIAGASSPTFSGPVPPSIASVRL